jgi:hypothetical protein
MAASVDLDKVLLHDLEHDARFTLGDKVQHVRRRGVDAWEVVKVLALLARDRASVAT